MNRPTGRPLKTTPRPVEKWAARWHACVSLAWLTFGRRARAVRRLRRAVELDHGNFNTIVRLGRIAFRDGNYGLWRRCMLRAKELSPTRFRAIRRRYAFAELRAAGALPDQGPRGLGRENSVLFESQPLPYVESADANTAPHRSMDGIPERAPDSADGPDSANVTDRDWLDLESELARGDDSTSTDSTSADSPPLPDPQAPSDCRSRPPAPGSGGSPHTPDPFRRQPGAHEPRRTGDDFTGDDERARFRQLRAIVREDLDGCDFDLLLRLFGRRVPRRGDRR